MHLSVRARRMHLPPDLRSHSHLHPHHSQDSCHIHTPLPPHPNTHTHLDDEGVPELEAFSLHALVEADPPVDLGGHLYGGDARMMWRVSYMMWQICFRAKPAYEGKGVGLSGQTYACARTRYILTVVVWMHTHRYASRRLHVCISTSDLFLHKL